MDKFKIGDKVNFVVERSLLSGVITKFYKNTYNEEECSIKTEIKTFPHILLQRVSKINDEDDLIKKIAELESKLIEKEKEIEESDEEWKEICDGKLETINRLIEEKHKLEQIITSKSHNKWLKAEAERYKNEYQSLKGYIDQLKQQLEESDAYKLRIELAGADETISQLKQQLAKKDKEIEDLKQTKLLDDLHDASLTLLIGNKTRADLWALVEEHAMRELVLEERIKQEKNQTAIAELEKVFRDFNHKIDDEFADNDMKYITLDIEDVNFYLQDKIKSLKGEK